MRRIFAAFIGVSLLSCSALAQLDRAGGEGVAASADDRPRIHVRFGGGTVGQYVELVRSQAKGANIVLSDDAAAFPCPAVDLTNVTVGTALATIQFVCEGPTASWTVRPIALSNAQADADADNFAVMVFPRDGGKLVPPKRRVQIYSIVDLLNGVQGGGGLARDHVLSALEAAIEVEGGPTPEVRFHSDSGLVIVGGTIEQLEAVSEVLDRLRDDTRQRRGEAMAQAEKHAEAMHRVRMSELEVARQEQFARSLQEQLDRMEALVGEGAVSAEEVAQLRQQCEMARLEVARAQAELEFAIGRSRHALGTIDAPVLLSQVGAWLRERAEAANVAVRQAGSGPEADRAKANRERAAEALSQLEALSRTLRDLLEAEGG